MEIYAIDETVTLDPSATAPPVNRISPALAKAMEIGALCNNASLTRNESGEYVGQSTDVALLNVLDLFGISDPRQVRASRAISPISYEFSRLLLVLPSVRSTLNRNTWRSAVLTPPLIPHTRTLLHGRCTTSKDPSMPSSSVANSIMSRMTPLPSLIITHEASFSTKQKPLRPKVFVS